MNISKKIIGVLVSGIADTFTVQTCQGVIKAAENKNIQLVIIPGKYIFRDTSSNSEIMYEYQYNTIFSYAAKQSLDALIIMPDCIACHTSKQRRDEFLQQFAGIPTVLIGSKIDGFLSVNYECYEGLKDGLEYLIKELQCKKIAMFAGPNDNTDAYERKQAFINILEENGIVCTEDDFLGGNLTRAQSLLFDEFLEKHPDLEAVFCVNDDTALAVYDSLRRKKLVPGKDLYVMGYDNTIAGAKATPALSTVMADATSLGEKALDLMCDLLNGKAVESILAKSSFIKRDSFGEALNFDASVFRIQNDPEIFERYFDSIFYRFDDKQSERKLRNAFQAILQSIVKLFEGADNANVILDSISKSMDTFLTQDTVRQADTDRLIALIESLSLTLREKYIDHPEVHEHITRLSLMAYRKMIRGEEQLQGNMLELDSRRNYDIKRFIANTMNFEKGSDQNYRILLEGLDWLDVKNAKIFTFANPITHLKEDEFVLPDYLYLKAILEDRVAVAVTKSEQKTAMEDLFRTLWMEHDSQTKILLPIFSNEIIYGVLICDMTEKLYTSGDMMANQIGASAKMLSLLRMNEDIQKQYEDNIRILRENNISLDTMAKTDGLTGLLNRRGFMLASQELLETLKAEKKSTLVAYIDMNNLKIINDRFGHEDGDFSLQSIGNVLRDLFPNAVIGRLGGDEFSLACEYSADQAESEIVQRIYQAFLAFNRGTDKSYLVTVSVGTHVVNSSDRTEVQDALVLADEKLYFEKMHRTKNVMK